jgi:hypothetical protein
MDNAIHARLAITLSVALACSPAAGRTSVLTPATQQPAPTKPVATRTLSGVVRNQWNKGPIANTSVREAGTQHRTTSDAKGSWRLPGLPTTAFVLQGDFIGYQTARFPIPASMTDSTNLVLELVPFGGPDSSMTEPLPWADLQGVLGAIIEYFGPSIATVSDHLAAVAGLVGGPPPPPLPPRPIVVLDSSGVSLWKQVPPEWIADWRAKGRLAAVCADWYAAECQDLGFAAYISLRSLPRRTAPDTAYADVQAHYTSAMACRKELTGGELTQESVRIVRVDLEWRAETFPGGKWLQGSTRCDPVGFKKQ